MASFGRAAVAGLLCVTAAGAAGQVSWDGDAGDLLWFTGANWSPDGVPGWTDTVVVNAAGVVRATGALVEVDRVLMDTRLFLDNTDMVLGVGTSTITGLRVENTILRSIEVPALLLLEGDCIIKHHGLRVRGGGVQVTEAAIDECTRIVAQDADEGAARGRAGPGASGLRIWRGSVSFMPSRCRNGGRGAGDEPDASD